MANSLFTIMLTVSGPGVSNATFQGTNRSYTTKEDCQKDCDAINGFAGFASFYSVKITAAPFEII